MARAGFCKVCGQYIWVDGAGAGSCGHPASDIENVYEVPEQPAPSDVSEPAGYGSQQPAATSPQPLQGDQEQGPRPAARRTGRIVLVAAVVVGVLAAVAAFVTRPQLVVTRISASGVEQGEPGEAHVTVKNEGVRPGTKDIVLTVDGQEVGRASVTVAPGETEMVSVPLDLDREPGLYRLAAKGFDAVGDVRVLTPAAMEVEGVSVEPKLLHAGIDDTAYAVATVANAGEASGNLEVLFTLDGRELGVNEVDVAGNATEECVYDFDCPSTGTHVLEANGVKVTFAVHGTSRPANGAIIVNKIKGGRNRLKIVNNFESDMIVVMSQPGDGKPALLAVYVRSRSSTAVTGVKDGTYQAYYSFGSSWCPSCKGFLEDREDGRFEATDRMTSSGGTYTQLTLTFGTDRGGSPTEYVGESEFPKL
jgi:hypothetical protein